jgi:hypothetical protein
MATNPVSALLSESAPRSNGLSKRLVRYFKAQVEDWYDECRHLTGWEERNLLDHLSPERLAEHTSLLDDLEQAGRWLSRATQSSDYPDHATAELVAMTLQDLKDRRALWHGTLTPERREVILREVFHES